MTVGGFYREGPISCDEIVPPNFDLFRQKIKQCYDEPMVWYSCLLAFRDVGWLPKPHHLFIEQKMHSEVDTITGKQFASSKNS